MSDFKNPFQIKVWAQMFFNDGTVTQGKYLPDTIFTNASERDKVAYDLLNDTNRKKGFLFIWGGKKFYGRQCELIPKNQYSFFSLFIARLKGDCILKDQVITYKKL